MTTKSPDSLEIRGKPVLGSRFGKKAGFIVGSLLAVALGLVIYGIATREPAGTSLGDGEKVHLAPSSAKRLYEGIGDGILGKEPSFEPMAPKEIIAAEAPILAAQSEAGAPLPQQPQQAQTHEEQAAARLREQRALERRKAIEADSGIKFGDSAILPSGQADADLRAATYQKMMAEQGQGKSAQQQAALKSGAALGITGQEDPNLQSRKEGFVAAAAEQEAVESLRGTRRLATSAYELKASTVIPAILLTGLNSDLPGEIIGQVSENIFDTATGKHLLIPQGARVFGRYDSRVAYGQDRALVVWDRLLYPDGSSITLQGMGGADKSGYAGFHDQVNNHIWRLIGYGALSSAFASVFQITQRDNRQDNNNGVQSPQQVAAGEVARQFSQMGIQITQRNLNIQPTIEIRPGYQFVVMVNRDMVFQEAYKDRSR